MTEEFLCLIQNNVEVNDHLSQSRWKNSTPQPDNASHTMLFELEDAITRLRIEKKNLAGERTITECNANKNNYNQVVCCLQEIGIIIHHIRKTAS